MGLESTMQNGKDTVYVDVDDEITTVIEKVTGSKQNLIALVLPKRATVFQSIVNMKLLKRSAESAGKNVVLITSESGLLPLAGAVGLYVAKTPQSKPEIPVAPVVHDGNTTEDDDTVSLDNEEVTAETAGDKPIGELAGDDTETVELDDDPEEAAVPKAKKSKKSKQQKVPSFSRFQKRLMLAILAVLLLGVGWYYATRVMPRATIIIGTDATDYNSSLAITLDTAADGVNLANSVVSAQTAQQSKVYTGQAPATGQKNKGEKASGSVKLTACVSGFVYPKDVPAGTGVSTNGLTFITQDKVSFNPAGPDPGNSCYKYTSGSVDIVAQNGGANYNVSGAQFSVSGRTDINGTGSATGGTDNVVKVVSQDDVDKAKAQINASDSEAIKAQLKQQLQQSNLYPLPQTFGNGNPQIITSVPAGTEAEAVTATENATYTMFGVKRDYLDQLIKDNIKQQIDTKTQTIINDGLDKAVIKVESCDAKTCKIALETTATVGPKLNPAQIKEQIKGKKSGYVKSTIGEVTGVTDVQVKLSPFWVSSVPNNTNKITIQVGKSSGSDGS